MKRLSDQCVQIMAHKKRQVSLSFLCQTEGNPRLAGKWPEDTEVDVKGLPVGKPEISYTSNGSDKGNRP